MTSQSFSIGDGARGRRHAHGSRRAPDGSTGVPGRVPALLAAVTAALGVAFVYAPRLMAASTPGGGFSDQRSLIAYLRNAFVGYWGSGSRSFAPQMQRVVDYWFRYHVAKALIAALLLGVLTTLAVLLWRTYLRAELGPLGRAAAASAWCFTVTLALCSVALLAANIQGAVAPFASLLSMLPAAEPDKQFTATVAQVRLGLAHYSSADGRTSPALRGMVDDFALYHVALFAVAVIVVVALIGISALTWRRFARATGDRRARRAFAGLGVASIVVALAVSVVAAANLSTVADPAPALLALFQGSW
jgi:hypothetical protein